MKQILLVITLCVSTSFCAAASSDKNVKAVGELTPEHFVSTATVEDDSLDTVAKISTYKGFQEKKGLLRMLSAPEPCIVPAGIRK